MKKKKLSKGLRSSSSGQTSDLTSESRLKSKKSDNNSMKLGTNTIELFKMADILTIMKRPKKSGTPLRISISNRCGKQGAWRARPKLVFLPQVTSFTNNTGDPTWDADEAGFLAIRRTTGWWIKVHTHDNAVHHAHASCVFPTSVCGSETTRGVRQARWCLRVRSMANSLGAHYTNTRQNITQKLVR